MKLKNLTRDNKFSISAIAIAFFSFFISVVALYYDDVRSGELIIYEPTSFCIVRGYSDIGFKSDHLVIPLIIENTGNGVKILQAPVLSIKEKNSYIERIYTIAGTIPDFYRITLDEAYEIGFGIHVPENSVDEYRLVFHVENWWDTTKPEYSEFHFESEQEWSVSLSYFVNNKPETWTTQENSVFFTMPIYGTIDRLEHGGNYNSDCFALKYE